jgi:hypothetical protein
MRPRSCGRRRHPSRGVVNRIVEGHPTWQYPGAEHRVLAVLPGQAAALDVSARPLRLPYRRRVRVYGPDGARRIQDVRAGDRVFSYVEAA